MTMCHQKQYTKVHGHSHDILAFHHLPLLHQINLLHAKMPTNKPHFTHAKSHKLPLNNVKILSVRYMQKNTTKKIFINQKYFTFQHYIFKSISQQLFAICFKLENVCATYFTYLICQAFHFISTHRLLCRYLVTLLRRQKRNSSWQLLTADFYFRFWFQRVVSLGDARIHNVAKL